MKHTADISIQDLVMRYGTFTALDRVSFSAHRGEILGLLGPNGAGKTTLMRVITTFLYPSSGTVSVAGFNVVDQPIEVRRRIGYLPETAPLYFGMQTDEYLSFIGRARFISGPLLQERLEWVKRACGLRTIWKHTLSEVSKGYRQRVGLAQALIHDPDVLILDEPTSGLDPLQIIDIRKLVMTLAENKTIIFSTHILQEVEAMANRIVIINDGRIVANGTREEIVKKSMKVQRVRLAVVAARDEIHEALNRLNVCDDIQYDGPYGHGAHSFVLRAGAGHPVMKMVDELIKERKWPLLYFAEESASLEESFISLLSDSK